MSETNFYPGNSLANEVVANVSALADQTLPANHRVVFLNDRNRFNQVNTTVSVDTRIYNYGDTQDLELRPDAPDPVTLEGPAFDHTRTRGITLAVYEGEEPVAVSNLIIQPRQDFAGQRFLETVDDGVRPIALGDIIPEDEFLIKIGWTFAFDQTHRNKGLIIPLRMMALGTLVDHAQANYPNTGVLTESRGWFNFARRAELQEIANMTVGENEYIPGSMLPQISLDSDLNALLANLHDEDIMQVMIDMGVERPADVLSLARLIKQQEQVLKTQFQADGNPSLEAEIVANQQQLQGLISMASPVSVYNYLGNVSMGGARTRGFAQNSNIQIVNGIYQPITGGTISYATVQEYQRW